MPLFVIVMDSPKDLITNVKECLDQEPTMDPGILSNP